MSKESSPRMLGGYRALDLTDLDGALLGKYLGSMGVDVIKVEPPGGDPARQTPPLDERAVGAGDGLVWQARNAGKRSITCDLQSDDGRVLFLRLAAKADFVIESFSPGYMASIGLGYEALHAANPRIVLTSLTPFGQFGPYAAFKGGEMIISAMGGVSAITGDTDRPPIKEGPETLLYIANLAALTGTMVAHHYRQMTGQGQHVDVSQQHVAAVRGQHTLFVWDLDKVRLVQRGVRAGPASTVGMSYANPNRATWQCKDGYVFWNMSRRHLPGCARVG